LWLMIDDEPNQSSGCDSSCGTASGTRMWTTGATGGACSAYRPC